MSLSRHERGDFIREKMGLSILRDLGKGKITAKEAGETDDLMRDLQASGVTFNLDLAKNERYLMAVEAWRRIKQKEKS